MVDVAKVNLYGRTMGYVRRDDRYDRALFEYDADFVRSGLEPSPLVMPVREGRVYSFGDLNRVTFKGLPGLLLIRCRILMVVRFSTDGLA